MAQTKRHCIIGAGFSGLTIAKRLVELGEDFVIYDANPGVGGLWHTGAYDSAHLVSSKGDTQFPDFPMPDHYPDFPSKRQMQAYLAAYAEHYEILPRVRLETRVKVVRRAPDHERTKDWIVELEDGSQARFGTVVLANGHLSGMSAPRIADYPGTFEGEILTAASYRNAEPFRGKRILVVGAGNTGCDVAVDASWVADKTHLSMREGQYFLPKMFMGIPLSDLSGGPSFPWFDRLMLRFILWISVGDLSRYGLPKPAHKPLEKHPTINTLVLYQLKHGHISAKPEIARYDGHTVEFVDGTREDYDIIVFAIGYDVAFPMLDPEDDLIQWEGRLPILFWGMMVPEARGLFLAGLGQAQAGGGPLFEAGGDILARLMAREISSEEGVMALIEKNPTMSFAKRFMGSEFVGPLDETSHPATVVWKQIKTARKVLDEIGCP